MTSIPADPTLVLGNIIETYKIDQLKAIAEIQKPVDLANDRLNDLTMSSYKINMIYQQMVNMRVEMTSLTHIQAEQVALKAEMADAAIDLGQKIIESEKGIRALKEKFAQTKISKQVESPMNYELSEVKPFPLSFDSLKFDVQFFQVQKSEDSSTALATSVSSHVASSFSSWWSPSMTAEASASAHSTAMRSSQSNMLDGTIVITAYATHKQVDIMSPFVMDPQKAVNAWNYVNPKDKLKCNAADMWTAALLEEDEPKFSMQILTGCAKSSSFIGYVHVNKTEKTTNTQVTSSVASAVKGSIENNMGIRAMSGSFSVSSEASASATSLLSTANLTTNCSLNCQGIMPSIVANTMETAVQNMAPDPSAVMAQLGAIADASSTDVNAGMASEANNARSGAQFIELNNSYVTNAVQALGEETRVSNKIIDINSMMTAFEDYIQKAIAGNCGIPTSFFFKDLHKPDIAKCYIKRYYPNGATNQKDAMAGQLGTTPEGGGGGDAAN